MCQLLANQVTDFFSRLAERCYCENDLSDITWALCQAVPRFRTAFAEFVGMTAPPETAVDVDREFDLGHGSRVDIACTVGSASAFVEVKIYDRNYHLSQYADRLASFPGSRLLLLTNHQPEVQHLTLAKQLGWCVCLWRDFVDFLDRAFGDDVPLVRAYIHYVKKVCKMIEPRDIRFDPGSLYSLVSLNKLIEEVIGGSSHDEFVYTRRPQRRDHATGWTGTYFQLQYRPSNVGLWPFFGLIFENPDTPCLGLRLDRDWNLRFLDTVAAALPNMAPFLASWSDEDDLLVVLPRGELDRFLALPLVEQRTMLQSIFSAMLRPVERHLASLQSETKASDAGSSG